MEKPRVRFAPSPTGYLHIGGLRTALYDYLFARKHDGDFILKIEDTDQKRYVEGAVESLIRSIEWCGLNWDEGVFQTDELRKDKTKAVASKNYPNIVEAGEYGPYIQSEKLEIYKKYAEQLVKDGYAYYCFCEPERLEETRKTQQAEGKAPMYDQYCLRNISEEEINRKLMEKCPHTIRLKVPKGEIIEIEDIVRGKVSFNTDTVDDQVLLKSDGFPTYHLANVIDDHDMKITHVIRGEEWLPSVPKHILLYKYLGWKPPHFAHVPLLLNPDKSKLSKRQGDVAVEDYIYKGYLKEAIINFVVFLGWNPGEGSTQEIFSIEELADKFDLARVHKGGAVFDIKKFDWINSQWIKTIDFDDLFSRAKEFYLEKDFVKSADETKRSDDYLKKVLMIERDRLSKLSEVGESNQFFFSDKIDYDKELLHWKSSTDEETRQSLEKSMEIINNIPESQWDLERIEKPLMEAAGDKRGDLLWPLRAALTGEKKSPSPFEVVWVLGKEKSIKRITDAISKLK